MAEDVRGVVRLGMLPDGKPEMRELHKHLVKYCGLWRAIGLKLGLKDDLLETISRDNSRQQQECFRVMLQKWLIQDVSPTWNTLELAITNAQRNNLSLDDLLKMPQSIVHSKAIEKHDQDHVSNREIRYIQKETLIVNPSKAIIEFAATVSRIEERLTKMNEVENLNAIKSICGYLPISNKSDKPMFTVKQLEEIDACNNIREIFRQLRFYLRWDDHLILMAILDRLDSEECEELLSQFQSKIDSQMKLEQIFEVCRTKKQEVPEGFDKMVAIVNKKYSRITKEEYDQLKCFIAKHCGVESYVLSPFLNMLPSSLLLEWLVPSTATTHMVECATKHQHLFIKESFVFLQIATTVILEIKSKELQRDVQLQNLISKQLNKLITSLSSVDQEATLSTLKMIFDNIIEHPDDMKYRQIKLANKRLTREVWQYPAGKELMKMSGWVVEGHHVRLRDDSCVQIVSQLLKSFLCSATGVEPFPDEEFQALIEAFYNGNIACIQMLVKVSHISPNGRIYSESGSSFNLLHAATIAQQINIVKLLLTHYSVDPYMSDNETKPYVMDIFKYSPQSFIMAILKSFGIKKDFKVTRGYAVLHTAIVFNCYDVVCFLLEECSGIDVNDPTEDLLTPLHLAYLYGHTQIAQYLIQHGADVYAVDDNDCTPDEYSDGHPDAINTSEYLQSFRKLHHTPFSIEHCYFMARTNLGIDEKRALSLTIEQFPSLKDDFTQPHHDIDHAAALEEFTQYITNSTQGSGKQSKLQKNRPKHQQVVHRECY